MTPQQLDFRDQRVAKKEDLLQLYFKLLHANPDKKIGEIFELMRRSPAPRFYISIEEAKKNILLIARNKLPKTVKNECKKRMYYDLYRLWQKACIVRCKKQIFSNGRVNLELVDDDFICQPAPEFYISSIAALQHIVYKEMKKHDSKIL